MEQGGQSPTNERSADGMGRGRGCEGERERGSRGKGEKSGASVRGVERVNEHVSDQTLGGESPWVKVWEATPRCLSTSLHRDLPPFPLSDTNGETASGGSLRDLETTRHPLRRGRCNKGSNGRRCPWGSWGRCRVTEAARGG